MPEAGGGTGGTPRGSGAGNRATALIYCLVPALPRICCQRAFWESLLYAVGNFFLHAWPEPGGLLFVEAKPSEERNSGRESPHPMWDKLCTSQTHMKVRIESS